MHALSIPTWVVHVSSVLEWVAAIYYIWQYGKVTGDRSWYNLSFAMLPALVSAMCACTWHFFDNTQSLDWLVIFQAAMTVVGNFTVCIAAWGIWRNGSERLRLGTTELPLTSSKSAKHETQVVEHE